MYHFSRNNRSALLNQVLIDMKKAEEEEMKKKAIDDMNMSTLDGLNSTFHYVHFKSYPRHTDDFRKAIKLIDADLKDYYMMSLFERKVAIKDKNRLVQIVYLAIREQLAIEPKDVEAFILGQCSMLKADNCVAKPKLSRLEVAKKAISLLYEKEVDRISYEGDSGLVFTFQFKGSNQLHFINLPITHLV